MCLIVIFSCIVVPYRLVTVSGDDDTEWEIINNIVDSFFVMDMILNFNTAYFNEDFVLIDDRKEICKHYIKTWFLLDLLAIVPLPQPSAVSSSYSRSNDINSVIRLTRLSRLYRLIKLLRLVKILKIFSE